MKVKYIHSATVIIESGSTKILCDPWFTDGAFYGSWYIYPPMQKNWMDLVNDIDYIYVSHVHPDHMDIEAINKLPDVPILILEYAVPFLKKILETKTNKQVIEISHGEKFYLNDDLFIAIYAADNCDPVVCGNHFTCWLPKDYTKTTQIDSMCVISDGKYTLLNTNDCPFPLSKTTVQSIVDEYKQIDFMLVGYGGASAYPQMFDNLTFAEKIEAANTKHEKLIKWTKNYLNIAQPKYFTPFAGHYYLAGKVAKWNTFRGVPELTSLPDLFSEYNNLVLLNRWECFDLSTGRATNEFVPYSKFELYNYIDSELQYKKFFYEFDKQVNSMSLLHDLKLAYRRFYDKIVENKFSTDTNFYLSVYDDVSETIYGVCFSCNQFKEPQIVSEIKTPYCMLKLDSRLLKNILNKKANWNNAEIGCHIAYDRNPDRYERGIYHFLNYLIL